MLIPEYQIFNEKVTYGWINAYKLSLFGLIAYKGIQHYCLLVANKSSQTMGEWGFVKSRQEEKLLGFRVSTSVFAVYASLILLTLPYQLTHLNGPANTLRQPSSKAVDKILNRVSTSEALSTVITTGGTRRLKCFSFSSNKPNILKLRCIAKVNR